MDGKNFDLEITSRSGILFSEECDFVVIPTAMGEIGVLKGHIPLMSVVSKGNIRIHRNGKIIKEIKVELGFAEVSQTSVNILVGKS
ncbi:MAG: F0F1 ATP synthase subunit epsilon [Candidatus Omnitrophota bacterium]